MNPNTSKLGAPLPCFSAAVFLMKKLGTFSGLDEPGALRMVALIFSCSWNMRLSLRPAARLKTLIGPGRNSSLNRPAFPSFKQSGAGPLRIMAQGR